MPGFIGNYKLPTIDQSKTLNSLGCKLVTAFSKNDQLNPPKPNILANIFLLHENTGELKAILQATEITAWRTAAASLVATKYLYSNRPSRPQIETLAIVGCGVQVTHRITYIFRYFQNKLTEIIQFKGTHSCYWICGNQFYKDDSSLESHQKPI